MLSNFKNLVSLTCKVLKQCEFQNNVEHGKLLSSISWDFCSKNQRQNFHSSAPRMKDMASLLVRKAAKHEAKREGEVKIVHSVNDAAKRKEGYFPLCDLSDTIINGIAFRDIPIVRIRATRNNTIMSLNDRGDCKLVRSCGTEGFKNTRKGTNVAAQTVGCSFSFRAIKRGYKNVRVIVSGLGPGRLSAIKGLQLGGMNVVSITDATIDKTSLRPRKQRRI